MNNNSTYGQILSQMKQTLEKEAFIPAPQGGQSPQGGGAGGPPGGDPSQGGQAPPQGGSPDPAQGSSDGGGGQSPQGQGGQQAPPDELLGNEQAMQQNVQSGAGQDPTSADLQPKASPQSLQQTTVTLSVGELLDLVSGGKASQSHLKTESMKVQHSFKHKKMLRDEQRKEQEDQQKQQQQQQEQAMQQQGLMGGSGIYGNQGTFDANSAQQAPGMQQPGAGQGGGGQPGM